MYSNKIQSVLDSQKIKIGEEVVVNKSGNQYEGILMPRSEIGNQNCIVIKLDSGYNIGVEFDSKTTIKKSAHRTPKAEKGEEEFELGKIKKSLIKVEFDPKKPPVSLIATGGTIASRVDYKTGAVRMQMDPKEFLHNTPELVNIVNLKTEVPFTKASEDMDHTDWQELAKLTAKKLNSGDQGVIITHGTDILHYTAAVLSFFLKNLSKPVVIVGAQKSPDRGSSDAFMNLICASYAATSDIGEVGVCMHATIEDTFCLFTPGTKVRKMDTVKRSAFQPVNGRPFAKIYPDGKIEALSEYKKRSEQKVEADTAWEPKVALVKIYPESDPSVLEWYISKGYRGFVLEGTGLGHVPTQSKKSWIPTIKKLVKDGIPVVVTSQTLYGRVNPNVYTNLRILFYEAGAIPGEDMTPETAWVKLSWVLGHTKALEEVRKLMTTNLVGEITERSLL